MPTVNLRFCNARRRARQAVPHGHGRACSRLRYSFCCQQLLCMLYFVHPFLSGGFAMRLTRAITHIRLADANPGKLAQLDALADAYMSLCQQYVTAFCTDVAPDKYAAAWLASPLSAR